MSVSQPADLSETMTVPDGSEVLNATVVAREDVNEYLSVVRVRPDAGVPAFVPGQFATLGLPRPPKPQEVELLKQHGKTPRTRITRRAYSIASSADERDAIELFVILVKEGKLTPKLWTIEEGGRLWMSEEIKGEFTLDAVPHGKDLVMVSTGTGLAPFISMYRTFRGADRWRSFTIVNGVRHVQDLGYVDEMRGWAAADPRFAYVPLVSRASDGDGWTGLRGRVNALLEGDAYLQNVGRPLDPATTHVLLCGNPDMIDGMQASLEQRGFKTHSASDPGNIHFERYW